MECWSSIDGAEPDSWSRKLSLLDGPGDKREPTRGGKRGYPNLQPPGAISLPFWHSAWGREVGVARLFADYQNQETTGILVIDEASSLKREGIVLAAQHGDRQGELEPAAFNTAVRVPEGATSPRGWRPSAASIRPGAIWDLCRLPQPRSRCSMFAGNHLGDLL